MSVRGFTFKNHMEKYRKINLLYFLIFTIMILVLPSIFGKVISTADIGFILSNSLIGLVSLIMIIRSTNKHAYSLDLVHWIFHFSFFFIAPLVQYLNDEFQWGSLYSYETDILIKTNILILVWQFFWLISSKLGKRISFTINEKVDESNEVRYFVSLNKVFLLTLISILVLGYQIYSYGFTGLFVRGADAVNGIDNSAILLIIENTGRAMPIVLLALLIVRSWSKKTLLNNFLVFIAIALALLTNFPVATPRFWTAAISIGLFFTFIKVRNKNLLVYLLLFGLNIIFPLLATARRVTSLGGFWESLDLSRTLSANLLIADYDAYSMIAHTMKYIEIYGISIGKQLLTVIFFFIPRSIWEDKSLGSGRVVADALNFEYNNVSSPLIAEGLINFGVFGIIIFAVVFALICSKVDTIYWLKERPFVKLIYPFWIGFFFFIMRGDLLSSFSYTLGFTICFIVFKPKLVVNNGT